MTKLEIYNQICKALPPNNDIEPMIVELCELIIKEINRKDSNIKLIDEMFAALTNHCVCIGASVSIDIIKDISTLSNVDYDLLFEVEQRLEIDIYNYKRIVNRPCFR